MRIRKHSGKWVSNEEELNTLLAHHETHSVSLSKEKIDRIIDYDKIDELVAVEVEKERRMERGN